MRLGLVGLVAFSMLVNGLEARPLPLTNSVGKTSFILKQTASKRLSFLARANGGPAAGWIHWRYAIEDTAGKRIQFGSGSEVFERSSFASGPLKVTVFADEILSVGFVTEPRAGEVVKLNVNARAAEFGLKDVFLLGNGDFVVSGAADVARVQREGEGVRISAEKPTVAVMYRPLGEIERIDGRVRERSDARGGGNVFVSRRKGEGDALGNGNVLRYAPVNWQQTTNSIEVEVMLRHRPMEFLVDFEKEKAGP
jgi:hypothetical protein